MSTLRIERMWRDVRGKVIQYYMTLFKGYEKEGFLIDDVWHIFTLQYMFMYRIQENLNDFKSFWNNHPLESEHNRTPIQLILLAKNKINYDYPIDLENFNIEVNHIGLHDVNADEDIPQVTCEPLICPLTPHNLNILKQRILPLTKYTPKAELTDWFHAALTLVLDLRDTQLA
jgi:hypothetical protein